MRRRRAPRSFAPALDRVASSVMPKTVIAEVQTAWEAAVGPRVAANAEPVSERAGTVTIRCSSSSWANELTLLGPVVVEALNRELGRPVVKGLRTDARPG